ncbi:radical SAM protein [Candidatus Dojkabacteria bacterium]|nr:radical SAM protein [Candidatus Dojkabacteria bacterium]
MAQKQPSKNRRTIGRVHSIESLGTLDGPGLRTVVFFQGCPLNCIFCHNIDAIPPIGGTEFTVDELLDRVLRNSEYWKKSDSSSIQGGVTLSGGDPLFQSNFVVDFVRRLQQSDTHVAIDTCLYTNFETIDQLIQYADLWMVSIKHTDSAIHRELTGADNKTPIKMLHYLDKQISIQYTDTSSIFSPQIRLRYLLIPGVTDSTQNISSLVNLAKKINNLEAVEILAYGDHAKHKWIEATGSFPMENIQNASDKDLQNAAKLFKKEGIKVIL